MGYLIQYQSNGGQLRGKRKKWGRVVLSVLAMSCGVIVWYQLYRMGVMSELEKMAQSLRSGEPLKEVFDAFCRGILGNG